MSNQLTEAQQIMRRTLCERCGICCVKGPPTLHTVDLPLIKEQKKLTYAQLYTLRKGEFVTEQIQGGLTPLSEEIIKIRSRADMCWTCLLYNDDEKACSIYADRPSQCRAFNCFAPEVLVKMYEKDRLGRFDVIEKDSALGELITVHEEKVAIAEIEPLAVATAKGDKQATEALLGKVLWETGFRTAFAEKTNMEHELSFFFGRPLHIVLRQFDLAIGRKGQELVIKKQI